MRFSDFQSFREQERRREPSLLDAAETNVYRALGPLRVRPELTMDRATVHRCDLARAWLQRFYLPQELSRLAVVCRGVRHALSLIFDWLRTEEATVRLPADVYPVYLELAHAAGLVPATYRTLPNLTLPKSPVVDRPEYLLVTNPCKPLGRFLSEAECASLVAWQDESPRRRILIDCVYDLGTPFHVSTRRLLATGRCVLLHSITKGWLWPQTFGVVLLGKHDDNLAAAFRADPPTQEQLWLADQMLTEHADVPRQVIEELGDRAQRLFSQLPSGVLTAIPAAARTCPGNYYFPIEIPPAALQSEHGVLALPASVFGATTWTGSVLTSLADVFAGTLEKRVS